MSRNTRDKLLSTHEPTQCATHAEESFPSKLPSGAPSLEGWTRVTALTQVSTPNQMHCPLWQMPAPAPPSPLNPPLSTHSPSPMHSATPSHLSLHICPKSYCMCPGPSTGFSRAFAHPPDPSTAHTNPPALWDLHALGDTHMSQCA